MADDFIQLSLERETAILLQKFIGQLISQQTTEQKRSNESNKISSARLSILQFLIDEGPKTLKQLTNYRRVTAATMSRMVACLVDEGFVLKAKSKKDKRSKIFIITTTGRKLASDNLSRQLNEMIESIGNISHEEQIMLNKSIQLIKDVINLS